VTAPKAEEVELDIRSSNDAQEAFLREQISEDELRKYVARFGLPSQDTVHPADAGYERKLPDFVFGRKEGDGGSFKDRAAVAEAKAKVREDVLKAAEKEEGNLAKAEAERTKEREKASSVIDKLEAKRFESAPANRP
jgi:hypothetical protein